MTFADFISTKAQTVFRQANDVRFPGERQAPAGKQSAYRFTDRNPIIVTHSSALVRHPQDVSDGVSRGEKIIPEWKI